MQTILIIEKDIEELDSLLAIFHEWHTELDILTARDGGNALNIMKNHQIDIVLCSTSIQNTSGRSLLSILAAAYPTVPSIGLCTTKEDELHDTGVSFHHTKPYNSALLFEHITELLVFSEKKSIKDIPAHSLLQILETEERTCTLKVYGKHESGLIFVASGIPIAAETELSRGETAFLEIIGWENSIAELLHFNGQRNKEIEKPLIALIMEGIKVGNGQDENGFGTFGRTSDQSQLKKVSTIGQRISLDISSRVKVEFNQINGSYNSTTVGMIPDEYLIITCPSQLIAMDKIPDPGCQVLTKYVHMGKLCLFKSRIIETIEQPQHLLFVDYPASIHYHELRQAKRNRIYIPCTLNIPGSKEYFGTLVDLSSSGGLCVIKAKGNHSLPAIHIDQQIELSCLLPGMKEEQRIKGLIRNMKQNSHESKSGIEFFNMHSYLIESINRYLYSIEN